MISPSPDDMANTQAKRRRGVMAICAHATLDELNAALAAVRPLPDIALVRAPELGLVMLRGRTGGDGAPFNLGEATVTRAVVKLASGVMGTGYVLGRSLEKARAAAAIEALAQVPLYKDVLEKALIEPVSARLARERAKSAAETAATRVDFFTVARGED